MSRRAKAAVTGTAVNDRLQSLADAISQIEGGTVSNPGNIRDNSGAIGKTGNLLAQLNTDFISQNSRYYDANMTFRQFAWMYVSGTTVGDWDKVAATDNPDTWADFVSGHLGTTADSKVWDYLNS